MSSVESARECIIGEARAYAWGVTHEYAAHVKDPMYSEFRKDQRVICVWWTRPGVVMRVTITSDVETVPRHGKSTAIIEELRA